MPILSHCLLLAALVPLAGAPGRPPSPEEQRLFDQGTQAFASGDPQAAEKAWQAGYALGHDPAFLVHIAEAQEKLGAPAQAVATYRRYLGQVPDASDRADIEQRLARLGVAAGPTTRAQPAGAATTDESPADFGAAAAPPSAPPAATAPPGSPRDDAEHPTGPEPGGASDDSGWNRYNLTAVVATAAAVALLGTAGFFAASAGSHRDDINRLVLFRDPTSGAPLPYSSVAGQYTQDMTDGRRDARVAKIALLGAAASAAVATLFYVFDATLGQKPTVSLAPTGSGLAAIGGWAWRF
jgi:hypothetical protein